MSNQQKTIRITLPITVMASKDLGGLAMDSSLLTIVLQDDAFVASTSDAKKAIREAIEARSENTSLPDYDLRADEVGMAKVLAAYAEWRAAGGRPNGTTTSIAFLRVCDELVRLGWLSYEDEQPIEARLLLDKARKAGVITAKTS